MLYVRTLLHTNAFQNYIIHKLISCLKIYLLMNQMPTLFF